MISKCSVKHNQSGIIILGADPEINDNDICFNKKNGILVVSDDLQTLPKIMQNTIHDNEKNGIKCKGEKNNAQIVQNQIYLNRKSGVYCKSKASIQIFKNDIYKNISQGICVQETSSVFAEHNIIRENIKANIAIGGRSEKESIILRNTITEGRCEGIFLMESIMCRVFYNNIVNNHVSTLVLRIQEETSV